MTTAISTGCMRPEPLTTGAPIRSATLPASRVADMIRTDTVCPVAGEPMLSRVRARPRSVWRFRSWNSSKMTIAVPVRARVSLQAPGQDAFGDDLDPGRVARPAVVAGDVADRLPDFLAKQMGHPAGGGPRRQPPRFEHHDLPVQPRLARAGAAGRWSSCPNRGGQPGPPVGRRERRRRSATTSSIGRSVNGGSATELAPSRMPEPEAILVREDVDQLSGRDPRAGSRATSAR